ncbi:MAG: AraC family transcriptional regulator [Rhodocyclaceae bacterium]|nr:AraC family transcriptional regulator [Rhodocyclaceae bacterium]
MDNSAISPRSRATVAPGFVTGMLAGPLRAGRDAAPLLAAAGIDMADSARRIPVDRYAALYNMINRELDDEGFGLFSQPMRVGSFEFLCRGLVSSPNLAEALDRASRFLRLVLPDLAVALRRGPGAAELAIAETRPLAADPDDPARIFAFEWLLRLLHGLSCWLVGRGIALDAVTFPYPPPAHADDYALIYTERSEFGGGELVARFQSNLLDLPIRRDEADLAAFLEGAPGKLTMLYRRDREMVLRVRDMLRGALPANLEQEAVAARLNLSARTLHRRLAEEGSSFRSIKDALRRDLAVARLVKTDQSVAAIAAELGYADPSAFYRAFIGWTDMNPRLYRERFGSG